MKRTDAHVVEKTSEAIERSKIEDEIVFCHWLTGRVSLIKLFGYGNIVV